MIDRKCTGIKDINGEEIYTMDIVKMISKIPGREHIKAFKIVHEQFANKKGVILPDHLNYEVIGNYYGLPGVAKMLNLDINENT